MEPPGPVIEDYTLDDDLLTTAARDRSPGVRVYRPSGTWVVLGRGSKPEAELHLEACLADRVPLMKRRGGGCAVVLDPGNVIVSLVLPLKGFRLGRQGRLLDALSRWLLAGLERVGVSGLHREGVSDLVFEGRKISGSCIYRAKDLLYYSSTLLVTPDQIKVDRYLGHPPREPSYRKGRSHAAFMGSLSPGLWIGSAPELADALEQALTPRPIAAAVQAIVDRASPRRE